MILKFEKGHCNLGEKLGLGFLCICVCERETLSIRLKLWQKEH